MPEKTQNEIETKDVSGGGSQYSSHIPCPSCGSHNTGWRNSFKPNYIECFCNDCGRSWVMKSPGAPGAGGNSGPYSG